MESPAVVVDHDPQWALDFRLIRTRLEQALPPDVAVEHVGSTAVLGLAAKPIIDVDVVVRRPGDITEAIAGLETLGYEHRGDQGIAGREAFSVLPGLPHHHVYVVVAGSEPHRDHVDLRDYLRANASAAHRYAAEKRRLAHLLSIDRDSYVDGKAWLVQQLLAESRQRKGHP